MPDTLTVYNRIAKLPFGNRIFTRMLTLRVPYFSTIYPYIAELRPGFCRVEMKERRSIHNHISTIHAGALCNLCELTGGLAVEVTVPPDLRWLPKEMTVQYLKKGKGKLTAISDFDPAIIISGDIPVPVNIFNESGDAVLKASITFYFSQRSKIGAY
jgi:acyl-coenzyme A thioesterase PaaI-like protein